MIESAPGLDVWSVRIRHLGPERPHLPPLRVPGFPEALTEEGPDGDDIFSVVLGLLLLPVKLAFLFCLLCVWGPLWTAKICWFLLRHTITAAILCCGLVAALFLPWPWEVVARNSSGHEHRLRVAGWPAALRERHRWAQALTSVG